MFALVGKSGATRLFVWLLLTIALPAFAGRADEKGCAYFFSKFKEAVRNPSVYLSMEWIDRVAFALDLGRHEKDRKKVYVHLKDLHPNHLINTVEAQEKTKERAERLRSIRADVLQAGRADHVTLAKVMPSEMSMKVMPDRYGNLIIIEGVGRYFALKEAFGDNPDLLIELDYIDPNGDRPMQIRLDRILGFTGRRVPPPKTLPVIYSAGESR